MVPQIPKTGANKALRPAKAGISISPAARSRSGMPRPTSTTDLLPERSPCNQMVYCYRTRSKSGTFMVDRPGDAWTGWTFMAIGNTWTVVSVTRPSNPEFPRKMVFTVVIVQPFTHPPNSMKDCIWLPPSNRLYKPEHVAFSCWLLLLMA